jgi:hypothetical protein
MRETDRDEQSSKRVFDEWGDPNKLLWMVGWFHTARLFWSSSRMIPP